jgi:hypothetical protein
MTVFFFFLGGKNLLSYWHFGYWYPSTFWLWRFLGGSWRQIKTRSHTVLLFLTELVLTVLIFLTVLIIPTVLARTVLISFLLYWYFWLNSLFCTDVCYWNRSHCTYTSYLYWHFFTVLAFAVLIFLTALIFLTELALLHWCLLLNSLSLYWYFLLVLTFLYCTAISY